MLNEERCAVRSTLDLTLLKIYYIDEVRHYLKRSAPQISFDVTIIQLSQLPHQRRRSCAVIRQAAITQKELKLWLLDK
jgi:hypothetical protein